MAITILTKKPAECKSESYVTMRTIKQLQLHLYNNNNMLYTLPKFQVFLDVKEGPCIIESPIVKNMQKTVEVSSI